MNICDTIKNISWIREHIFYFCGMPYTVASLFAGIGGIDKGFEQAGNAVSVPVIKRLATNMIAALDSVYESTAVKTSKKRSFGISFYLFWASFINSATSSTILSKSSFTSCSQIRFIFQLFFL